jgi:hypothetical protein
VLHPLARVEQSVVCFSRATAYAADVFVLIFIIRMHVRQVPQLQISHSSSAGVAMLQLLLFSS